MKAKHVAWAAGAVGLLLLLRRGAGWGKRGSGEGWGPSPDEGGDDKGGDEDQPEPIVDEQGNDRGRAPLLVVDSPKAASGK